MAAVLVFVSRSTSPLPTTSAADAAGHTAARRLSRSHDTVRRSARPRAVALRGLASRAEVRHLHRPWRRHGPPQPPEYLHGVLCVDGVEVSTNQGHYVALGIGSRRIRSAEMPTRWRRMSPGSGGFGIAAHPFSDARELAWGGLDGPARRHRMAERRQRMARRTHAALARALIGYLARPAGALASLLDRPVAALAKRDDLAARRHIVAVAGHDAHGGFGQENGSTAVGPCISRPMRPPSVPSRSTCR